MKHTKGKWEYSKVANFSDTLVSFINCGEVAIAQTRTNTYNSTKEETEANARLIASAPDLLKACEETVNLLKWLNEHLTENGRKMILKAQQAINKAKGEL